MKPKQWLMVSVALLICGAASPVWGQASVAVNVDGFLDPTRPIDLISPNEFDLMHNKLMTFDADLFPVPPGGPPSTMFVQFDWLDPFGGGFLLSPIFPHIIVADPLTGGMHIHDEWTIPYCPQEVSLHLFTQNGAYEVHGVWTHQCIVPEPSSMALIGLAIVPFACVVWRKRKS